MAYNANVHPGSVERTSVPPRSKHTADIDTSVAPAVTHERIQPTVQQDVLYDVRRDIHHYDHQTTIQPVIQHEYLPAKHWMQTPRGLVSIGPGTTVQELYKLGLRNGIQTAEGERVSGGSERKKALLDEIRTIEMAKVAQQYQSTEGISGVTGSSRQQQNTVGHHQHVPAVHHNNHYGHHHQPSSKRRSVVDDSMSSSRNAIGTHHHHSSVGSQLASSGHTGQSPQSMEDRHHHHYHHQHQNHNYNPNYYDKQAEKSKPPTTQDASFRANPSSGRDNGPLETDLTDRTIDRRAPLPPFEHASERHKWDHDGGTRQSWNESVMHGGSGGDGHRNKLQKINPPAHKVGVTKSEAAALY